MISIVDYGVGNIQAFLNIFNRLGIKAQRAPNIKLLREASHIILPGVGHFDQAMKKLNNSGLRDCLENLVINFNIPLLGICVGMQVLANKSEEGVLPGLGWIPGNVRAFTNNPTWSQLPLPHMGWNKLNINQSALISSENNDQLSEYYFLHSYYFDAKDKSTVNATSEYGFKFDAVVNYENIYGVQFHPEKSHEYGEKILKNFSTI
jgi:imidazole glycerol-phosphate synthase subunit HisH